MGGGGRCGAAGGRQTLSQNTLAPAIAALATKPVFYDTSGTPGEFARAAAFHNRKNYRGLVDTGTPGGTITVPPPDFHQILGHLADHPAILRRLGLIIDVTFTLPAVGSVQSLSVTPLPAIPGFAAAQIYTPWTQCVVVAYGATAPATFRPLYQDVEKPTLNVVPLVDVNGQLIVDNALGGVALVDPQTGQPPLFVDDLDLDHAVINVSNYAERAMSDLAASGQPSLQVPLPALRTTGFALHHENREGALGRRFTRTALWNPSAVTFVGEDLVRGYRPDVRTVTLNSSGSITGVGAWTSLCARSTQFSFSSAPIVDEGYVKAASMSAFDANPAYNVNETLFHWDGGSLVVGRPGKSVGAASAVAAGGDAGAPLPPAGPGPPASDGSQVGIPFTSTISPSPGSLPRLRFGTWYQLRVRAVNLVGGDMQASAPAPSRTTPRPRRSSCATSRSRRRSSSSARR